MFNKVFAAALLAALAAAKGKDDGSDRDNAQTQVMQTDDTATVTLNTYNDANPVGEDDELVYEFHGDFDIKLTQVNDDQDINYGFCLAIGDTGSYDCLNSKFKLKLDDIDNASQPGASQKFDVTDNVTADLGDTRTLDTAAQDWELTDVKSEKVCVKADKKVDCEKIQTHFFRTFTTSNADEDIQLTPKEYTAVKGFSYYQLEGGKLVKGELVDITPVKEAFQVALDEEEDAASALTTLSAAAVALAATLLF